MLSGMPAIEYIPTPTEIRQTTAKIRSNWTEAERQQRAGDRRGQSIIRQFPNPETNTPKP